MAVEIRLRRIGRKKNPIYRIVVADSRSPRDGRFIEEIGYYNPVSEPKIFNVDNEKALDWIKKGAKPTDTIDRLFKENEIYSGNYTRQTTTELINEASKVNNEKRAKKAAEDKKRDEEKAEEERIAEEKRLAEEKAAAEAAAAEAEAEESSENEEETQTEESAESEEVAEEETTEE